MSDQNTMWSFCRSCGGSRLHGVQASLVRAWEDELAPIDGCDTWMILECRGCETVTLYHMHWFSEDTEPSEDGHFRPIEYVTLYPPAPLRKMPEWSGDLIMYVHGGEQWIHYLYKDIYAAAGMQMYSMAAMGIRTIVDHIVTSEAGPPAKGEGNSFEKKLERMVGKSKMTPEASSILSAAFDAGSAAAHRGYKPTEADLFTLLDIAEHLLEVIYVEPERGKQRTSAASKLKARTPPRRR